MAFSPKPQTCRRPTVVVWDLMS
ncbi:uncharacterized protein METZ01_LOCUS368992 [marine metagenome]|uniref:Uncharacterized protein n=1 Tax=marine metagenome TaxID=408172 RepID=A0A382T428_9ZZZZ